MDGTLMTCNGTVLWDAVNGPRLCVTMGHRGWRDMRGV